MTMDLAAASSGWPAPRSVAAAQARDELDDFFENAAVGFHLVSGNGIILRANRAELQMLGYEADEYVGRHIGEIHADPATIDDILLRLGRGEQLVEYPARLNAKDGSIRHVRITSNARRRNDEVINTRCLTVDVTERLRVEELVRQQDQRLSATYERAGIGIAAVAADGRLQQVNAHLASLLGYPPEELVGRSIFDAGLTEDAERDRAQFHRQVDGEIDHYTIEKGFRRKDGGRLWVSITSSSVRDSENRFLYAVRVQHDVTDRKKAEESLARRAEEQAALYEFTAALHHSTSLEDVYERALDAIQRALSCERASVLVFDDSGVMRFVASRGLSESYRHAVDGHSPWTRVTSDPRPICIEDVGHADLSSSLNDTIRGEGIQALAFIPIVAKGKLLGKFMTYYDQTHVFTEGEIDLALNLATQLGFAIERVRGELARQHAERSAQQLAAIVESSDDAIVSKDTEGIILTWNQGAERLFGYTPEEAIGRPVTILIPPERIDEEPKILARIKRGERVHHYETVRRRKNGELVDISLTISPVRDAAGTIIGASKIARNITERKQADAKLKASERQLSDLLAAIPAAIYTTDAAGKITYYNQAAVEFAGREPTLGSDEWCVTWKLYWPDGTPLPHDQCPMAVALKEGRAIRNTEAVAERPDGTRVPFIPYPTPLRDAEGNIVGAVNVLVDVSERRQAETQQRILFNELNHRVKNKMQMLQSLLNLAGQKTRNEEARTILNEAGGRIAAMAASQKVLYGTADARLFEAQAFLDAVCHTARQGFSRETSILCEAGNIVLSNDAAMPLALIVNELLTNAVKHGVNGSGEGMIRVRLTKPGDSYLLEVEDEGPGFDLESVRARSSGLRLVEGLARQLGGSFEVTQNAGNRCSIQFP